jgi:hypothetical protein
MPKKSHQGKKIKGKRRIPVSARQPVVAPVSQQTPAFKPPASPGTPTTSPTIPQHSYVVRELKRIGIIAGAMFIILIVLTFVLS